MLQTLWKRESARIDVRDLRLTLNGETGAYVQANRALAELVFSNLLGNAVAHSDPQSEVTVTIGREGTGIALEIANPQSGLTADDLGYVFERFWRKDLARRADGHTGLGLALVQSCAATLGWQVSACLAADDRFVVRIAGVRPAESAMSALATAGPELRVPA